MSDEVSLLSALRADTEDTTLRLAYADWLDDHDRAGAAYLRAEVSLHQADSDSASDARRELLRHLVQLPADEGDRFAQPDMLLAPPVPFRTGWATTPREPKLVPYRKLPNLNSRALDPALPWLSGEGARARLDQAEHEQEELSALAEVKRRAEELNLILPPGFEAFARDFPGRNAVALNSCEVCLHDAVVNDDFPHVGEGYLVLCYADMDYSNPHQRSWSLYLVPGIDWHCVATFELNDNADDLLPDDPGVIFYCAPSFQSFLYRWCHRPRRS